MKCHLKSKYLLIAAMLAGIVLFSLPASAIHFTIDFTTDCDSLTITLSGATWVTYHGSYSVSVTSTTGYEGEYSGTFDAVPSDNQVDTTYVCVWDETLTGIVTVTGNYELSTEQSYDPNYNYPIFSDVFGPLYCNSGGMLYAPEITTVSIPDATEDSTYTISVEINDPDEGDLHTFELVNGPAWLSIGSESGVLTGTPENSDVGVDDSLTVRVTDSYGLTDETSYAIDVLNVNDLPEIVTATLPDALVNQDYNAVIKIDDPDSCDTHTYELLVNPGWLSIDNSGNLSGIPDVDDIDQEVQITARVADSGTPVLSDTLFTTISVILGFNLPPELVTTMLPDATEDAVYNTVIAVTDPNIDDTHTFEILNGPEWLSIDEDSGELSGTPDNYDVGVDIAVSVRVTDNGGLADNASYTIDVFNINSKPTILTTMLPDAEVDQSYAAVVVVTDPDAGETFTYTILDGPGWLSVDGSGNLTGTPGDGDEGVDVQISVMVTDSGTPALKDTLSTTITVHSIPVIAPEIVTTSLPDATEDTVFSVAVEITDPDIGDSHIFVLLSGPGWLSIGANNGILSGTPGNDDVGVDITLTVRVTDSGGFTDEASYTIDVLNVNDAPAIITATLPDADVNQVYSALIEITDPDIGDSHVFELLENPGWLSIDGSGNLTGTPGDGDEGENVQISVMVTDSGTPALTDTLSTTITVKAVPVSPPEITTDSLPDAEKNTAYNAQVEVTDPDIGDSHIYVLLSGPGWLSIGEDNGILSGTPGNDDVGVDITLTVRVTDSGGFTDEASYTIDVLDVNTAPQILTDALPDAEVSKVYSVLIEVAESDIGDTLRFELLNGPGWLSIDQNSGVLSGIPGNFDEGFGIALTVQVTDSGDLTDEVSFTIDVLNVNDAPIIVTTSLPDATVNHEYSTRIMVYDPDMGNTHTYLLLNGPDWLSFVGNGNLTGTPDSTDIGEDIPIMVQVTDSGNPPLSDLFSTTIAVLPELHYEPEITTLSIPNAFVDSVFSIQIEAIDADEGDSLYYELVESPDCFSIDPQSGILSGVPDIENIGSDLIIIVRITDRYNLTAEITYTFSIQSLNTAPSLLTETLPEAEACELYSTVIEIADPDSFDTHIYELLTGPEWLTIDELGSLSGMPVSGDVGEDIQISIQVTDSGNPPLSDTLSTTIAVVIPEIVSLVISPDGIEVPEGEIALFSAVACDADGDTIDVAITWSAEGEIGEINENGVFTATSAGEGFVTATYGEISANTPVEVQYIREYEFEMQDNSTYIISDLRFPLDYMNGIQIHLPEGSISENIAVKVKLPSFANINDTQKQVTFEGDIISGFTFEVKVGGTIISPYVFDRPIELIIPYDEDILADRGIDPSELGVFFVNTLNELISDGITEIVVDESAQVIRAKLEHLSDVALAPKQIEPVVEEDLYPTEFMLAQNYPNPFNPETTISFSIPEISHVEIAIYSVLGQRIRTLTSEIKSPGNYSIVWDATDENGGKVTSGTYIYRICAGKNVMTKKMVLLK